MRVYKSMSLALRVEARVMKLKVKWLTTIPWRVAEAEDPAQAAMCHEKLLAAAEESLDPLAKWQHCGAVVRCPAGPPRRSRAAQPRIEVRVEPMQLAPGRGSPEIKIGCSVAFRGPGFRQQPLLRRRFQQFSLSRSELRFHDLTLGWWRWAHCERAPRRQEHDMFVDEDR